MNREKIARELVKIAKELVAGEDVTKDRHFQNLAKRALREGKHSVVTIEKLVVTGNPSGIRLSIYLENDGYVDADYELKKVGKVRR